MYAGLTRSVFCLTRLLTLLALVAALGAGAAACSDESDEGGTKRPNRPARNNAAGDVGLDVGFELDAADVGDATPLDAADSGQMDAAGPVLNPCGGESSLQFEGQDARPGQGCGACADGVLVCDGPSALTCRGDTQPNACGGCQTLLGAVGEACGSCGGGQLACAEGGLLLCEGPLEQNACGGCETLAQAPGTACDAANGVVGIWACTARESLSCQARGLNACGGTRILETPPAKACGACGLGVTVCDGPEATRCDGAENGLNACGGCSPLAGQPEDSCGQCDGHWRCDGLERVVCFQTLLNACGGCSPLQDAPGASCGDNGRWICDGSDAVACQEGATNACGGTARLRARPGDACGPCNDGRVVCSGPDSTACTGATQKNACNGCALLAAAPGDVCGPDARWTCTSGGTLSCQDADERNACGGSTPLEDVPGTACGPCAQDTVVCDGPEATTCSGATVCPELAMETLAVSDISSYVASFRASITRLPLGGLRDHGFCWGLDNLPTSVNGTCTSLGALQTTGNVQLLRQALLPGRTYHVRAFAVDAGQNTLYANVRSFATPPIAPAQIFASQGEHRDRVAISWNNVNGATRYILFRDGQELARIDAPGLSYGDTAAAQPPVPGLPAGFAATQGGLTAGVGLSWSASSVSQGASHSYHVVAVFPEAQSPPTRSVTGYRGAEPVQTYEVQVDGGPWTAVGAQTSHTDTVAPFALISEPAAQATQGSVAAHVGLSLADQPTTQTRTASYRLRAVNQSGRSAETAAISGFRGVGSVRIQWQRSQGVTNADFSNLAGAASAAHQDTTAPADGSIRYYRAVLTADGAGQHLTPVVSGFRAALPVLSLTAVSGITTSAASLQADVAFLGAPNPSEHGFCVASSPNPSHAGGASCQDLGARQATGSFQDQVTGLNAGTVYYVRSFARTNAGYAYGGQASFVTRPLAPQTLMASTSSREHVAVSWSEVTGADAYKVFRDGELVATVTETSYLDAGAGVAAVPAIVVLEDVSDAEFTDRVRLRWSAPEVIDGALHTYKVVAVNASGDSADSAEVEGRRAANPVTGYQVSRNGSEFEDTSASDLLEYEDFAAPAAQIFWDEVQASQGLFTAVVAVGVVGTTTVPGAFVDYQVRALNSTGAGLPSSVASGRRGVGELRVQWQRSLDDQDSSFQDISTDDPSLTGYDDGDAPEDGTPAFYRAVLRAEGAASRTTESVSGFRAAFAALSETLVSDISTDGVFLEANLDFLGAPSPLEHGFCLGDAESPSHVTDPAGCVDLGPTDTLGLFSTRVEGLTPGAVIYVRAFARTNAGYAYGPTAVFGTRTLAVGGLTASTNGLDAVELSWTAPQGAQEFAILRDGNLLALVTAPTSDYRDEAALAGALDGPPAVQATGMNLAIEVGWTRPEGVPGALHSYEVVAFNAFGLASLPSNGATGQRRAPNVLAYEINFGDELWTLLDDAQVYYDNQADPATLVPPVIEVSQAQFEDRVRLMAMPAQVSLGQERTYRVRAILETGDAGAPSAETGAQRTAGPIFYAWERTPEGFPQADFVPLLATCADQLECDDMSPADDGSVHMYRLAVSADGAQTVYSSEAEGYRAVLSLAFDLMPSGLVTAGETFEVALSVRNQLGQLWAEAGIPVSLALSQNTFASGSDEALASTDANGQALFLLSIESAATGYILAASSTYEGLGFQIAVEGNPFSVTAAAPQANLSSIDGIDGIPADGISECAITILLADAYNNPVEGITPSFQASGSGNAYGSCTLTDPSGISQCSMTSIVAGTKMLSITTPVSVDGVAITFLDP